MRVLIISLLFISVLSVISKNTGTDLSLKRTSFEGVVYDVRNNKHLTLYIKTKNSKIFLFAPKLYDNIYPGDTIEFKAKLKPASSLKISGFRKYLFATNVSYIGYASYIKKLHNKNIMSFIEILRKKIEREFYYFLGTKENIFLQNAVFGDSTNKSRLKSMFINTQTAHILSVSGLHMGFVFGLFYFLFYYIFSNIRFIYKRFSLKTSSAIFAMLPTFLYFAISGFHIPAIRSFFMVFVFVFALIFGYIKNSYNILFLVASLIIPIFGYKTAFNPSFIMSFFMSFAAIFLYGVVKQNDYGKLKSYVIFSILISVFAMPISSFYFHKIAYLSFLSNFIVVPLFGFVVMPLSFASIIASFVPIFEIKYIFFSILNFTTYWLLKIVEYFAQINPINAHISIFETSLAYIFLFGLLTGYLRFFKIKHQPHQNN